ncbi:serine/threonine-protein kinase [Rhodococcus sp. USK13]|uniref:serine/threonine-protein kinase n=1 Tax=Rhodococcus sp. USK13 TaxID=2806442 RepID=UPI001BCBD936|nr:serine/threonine-protein kinase [Rhodococcus sp. USK13]
MGPSDPFATQREGTGTIIAELATAGFTDAVEVGRGGFGVVYRCVQRELDRLVAIKVLTADLDPTNVDRFLREQRAMGRLSGHPNIATILQVGVTERGRPFMVMPYFSRGSLDESIRRSGPLSSRDTVELGVSIAAALEAAHQLAIVHRDVKPANIMLTEYGGPQLTDFGIARIPGGFRTTTGVITGSPAFTAPEVLTGEEPTVASDIYSLGATLFCALTGHAAFERRHGEKLLAQFVRITSDPAPPLNGDGIPPGLAMAVEGAMSRDPAARPASASALADELHRVRDMTDAGSVVEAVAPARHTGSRNIVLPSRTGRRGHAMKPPPTPGTRFRPPISMKTLVDRPRLIADPHDGRRRRLTLIHGPAGYGKTTLATQWQLALSARGVATAWLTLGQDDNNTVWFLSHLVESLRQVRTFSAADELLQVLEEQGRQAEGYVLSSLIDDIHTAGHPLTLVLDDWHRITDAGTLGALEYLLDHGCHHLQFVVTSRTRAGLPVARMRVRDELIEIDAARLRFDVAEAKQLLIDVNSLPLTDTDVARLAVSTDGWVAALQLASLSLRDAENPHELIDHLSGRHRAIGDYLVENVLDGVDARTLDFLLATCFTERLCSDLAHALTQLPHTQAMLEDIEDRDLFLRSLDEDRHWFRYHHLFAEFLRRRLERDFPERIPPLHRAAADWFADHGHLGEAIEHLVAGNDLDRAAELIESRGLDLIAESKMSTVLGLIAELPPHTPQRRPHLQLVVAWANAILHNPGAVRTALSSVQTALDEGIVTGQAAHRLRLEAAVIRDVDRVQADAIDQLDAATTEVLEHPETVRPYAVAGAANVASYIDIYRFDFAAARNRLQWALPYHHATHGSFSIVIGHCMAGIAAHEQLDISAAETNFRTALTLARSSTGPHSYAARLAGALLGDLLYEQGDLDTAELLLDDSYARGAEGSIVDSLLATYGTGARIKAVRGDISTAARRLDEGTHTGTTLGIPRLVARIDNERVHLGIGLSGEKAGLRRAAATVQGSGVVAVTTELEENSCIRALLADPTPAQLDEACNRAAALARDVAAHPRPKAILEATLLHAGCLASAGRIDQAAQLLLPAATTCAQLGLTRTLIDAGAEIVPILEGLRDEHQQDPSPTAAVLVRFLTEILST